MTKRSPWDEASREAAYALYDDAADRCPQCKRPIEECQSQDADWYPQIQRCWRTAAETAVNRAWLARHEKAKPDELGYLPTDGARTWVAPIDLGGEDPLAGGTSDNPLAGLMDTVDDA